MHYFNYHSKYDRWIDPNNPNDIDIIGARSKAYGIGKSRSKKKAKTLTLSELTKSTEYRYCRNLRAEGQEHGLRTEP